MDVLLIPGFWLDGDSWEGVVPILEQAGHRVRALTLPGLESLDADRRGIGLRDHVDAVVAVVDELDGPVVLVGHSGGGGIAYAVADARHDAVARVVYVDSLPLGDGKAINTSLPHANGEIPLPDWSAFDEEDLRDLDDELRERFVRIAVPEPAGVAREHQTLSDERRRDVPATVIACEYSSAQLKEWVAEGRPYTSELATLRDVELVDLPTGHWPQLTRPDALAHAILDAIDTTRAAAGSR